jgi:aspartate kinase
MASPAGSTPTGSGSFIEPEREDLLRNSTDESVPWVVQKYGGTSVGKSLDSICAIVA